MSNDKKQIDDGGPAFPCIIKPGEFFDITVGDSKVRIGPIVPGLSKREYFAVEFAAAEVSLNGLEGSDTHATAMMGFEQADALLAALKGDNDA